jgi:hypothetical protein
MAEQSGIAAVPVLAGNILLQRTMALDNRRIKG